MRRLFSLWFSRSASNVTRVPTSTPSKFEDDDCDAPLEGFVAAEISLLLTRRKYDVL